MKHIFLELILIYRSISLELYLKMFILFLIDLIYCNSIMLTFIGFFTT